MEEAIIGKLQAMLAGRIDSECKVVCVLAETRKILETYSPKPTGSTLLKFYCHWALHLNLTHGRTTLPFLEQIEEYVASVLEGGKNHAAEHRMIREFVFLDTFREEFREFVRGREIPTGVCDEEACWQEFLANYAGVIEDGTFCCQEKTPLKLVEKVTFTKGREAPRGKVPFFLVWDIGLLDGRKMSVEVTSSSDSNARRSFGRTSCDRHVVLPSILANTVKSLAERDRHLASIVPRNHSSRGDSTPLTSAGEKSKTKSQRLKTLRKKSSCSSALLQKRTQSQEPHARVRRMGHPVRQRQRRRKDNFRFQI